MQTSSASCYDQKKHRQAFSLVELMVVTVIVVILAGMVAGVVVKAIDASRTTATLTTMEIIKSAISKQIQEVAETYRKQGLPPDQILEKVAQVFPTSFQNAGELFTIKVTPTAVDTRKSISINPYQPYKNFKLDPKTSEKLLALEGGINSTIEEKEKSVLLKLILDRGPKSKLDLDQLPKGALGQIINQKDPKLNLEGILDSWGDPIGIKIEYPIDLIEKIKPKITITSPNAVMKN